MLSKAIGNLSYGAGYLLIAMSATGFLFGGNFYWLGGAVVFLLLPLLEFFFPNWELKHFPSQNLLTELWLFLSPFILTAYVILGGYYFLKAQATWESLGIIVSTGALTGGLGITMAHELVHRKEAWQRALGVWDLLIVNFGHWGIEHVYGHHKFVSTPDDSATAAKDQSLYAFLFQDYFGGLRNAFLFEKKRLENKSLSFFRNRIVNYFIFGFVVLAILEFTEPRLIYFWIGQSIVAILLLLTVDYIEHYGLVRHKKETGLYEPVGIRHSWDTKSYLTNILLFNLGLHSHHHMKARVPYQNLRDQPSALYMPYGYSTMILMAFIPPLYKKKMNSILKAQS